MLSLSWSCSRGWPPGARADPSNDGHDPYFNEDEYVAFYTPPDPLPPGVPGDLIRTEPSRLVLEPSGQLDAIIATGTRNMYRSTDARGEPMAVTGTYFEPYNDWPGQGPRPLIVYGPGTQGQGDQCAPSRQFNQGCGAAASAAELASWYAPDLHVVGTYAGAPPADLKELFPYADGSALVGVVGYALNSVITTYPEFEDVIRSKLTPRGTDLLQKVQDQCIAEPITKFMFRHLQPYFNVDIYRAVNEEPFATLFDMQRIGRLKPNAPVMILSNRYDPLVPWTGVNQLGRDWCAQGADVQFWTNEEPPLLNKVVINHALPMLVDGERAMQWIADRFNGLPTTPNCGEF